LHDNVNQVLTTVKLYNEICLAGSEKRQELLNKSTRLLQTTISEIRGLSKRLSAPSLGGIQLYESIGELVEAINVTNRLKITYEHNIRDLKVAEDAHIAIYRIIQEHFTNILKHAKATTVSLQLIRNKKELKLTVNDNGIGFDPQLHYKGIGLENMSSRTESLNGQLQIESTPGMGCTIKVTVPIQ
ncbi:MAG: sensor histidine kinase, partial [Flavobacterium sp.]